MVITNPEKKGFGINTFERSCIQFDIQLFALIHGRKRDCIPPHSPTEGRITVRLSL